MWKYDHQISTHTKRKNYCQRPTCVSVLGHLLTFRRTDGAGHIYLSECSLIFMNVKLSLYGARGNLHRQKLHHRIAIIPFRNHNRCLLILFISYFKQLPWTSSCNTFDWIIPCTFITINRAISILCLFHSLSIAVIIIAVVNIFATIYHTV